MDKLSEDEKKENQIGSYSYFVCKFCKFNSKNVECKSSHAYKHRVYKGEKRIDFYQCIECEIESKFKLNGLQDHYFSVHKITFDCLFCDTKSKKKAYLVTHMKNAHLHREVSCNECEFSTTHKEQLYYHKTFHKRVNGHKCKYCSYRSDKQSKVINHEQQNHKKDLFNQ